MINILITLCKIAYNVFVIEFLHEKLELEEHDVNIEKLEKKLKNAIDDLMDELDYNGYIHECECERKREK